MSRFMRRSRPYHPIGSDDSVSTEWITQTGLGNPVDLCTTNPHFFVVPRRFLRKLALEFGHSGDTIPICGPPLRSGKSGHVPGIAGTWHFRCSLCLCGDSLLVAAEGCAKPNMYLNSLAGAAKTGIVSVNTSPYFRRGVPGVIKLLCAGLR